MLASEVHFPVDGFHSSATSTRPDATFTPLLVPPTTSTVPSGRATAFACRRANRIDSVNCHVGDVALRLMISAVLVGSPAVLRPPPIAIIRPVSYMTHGPYFRRPNLRFGALLQLPVPLVVSQRHCCSGPARNTLPSGAVKSDG